MPSLVLSISDTKMILILYCTHPPGARVRVECIKLVIIQWGIWSEWVIFATMPYIIQLNKQVKF